MTEKAGITDRKRAKLTNSCDIHKLANVNYTSGRTELGGEIGGASTFS